MFRELFLLAILAISFSNAVPFEKEKLNKLKGGWDSGSDSGWGWGEETKPAYDINPHFGFRQYSEMRYEPLTTPFMMNNQLSGPPAPTQMAAPLFKGQGPPYSPNLPGPLTFASMAPSSGSPYSGMSNSGYLT